MFHKKEVGARWVCQEVEETEHPSSNVRTPCVADDVGPCGKLHDESDEIQERRNTSVEQLRQNPVDRQIQHLPDTEQIDETPKDGCDERCDDHEQEPVGST